MIASALFKSSQDAGAANDARLSAAQQQLAAIRKKQAEVWHGGANPYSEMETQFKNRLGDINRAESEGSNNNIGSMLQSYFMNQKHEKPEAGGFGSDGLSAAMDKAGLGAIPLGGRDEYNAFKSTDPLTDRDGYDTLIGGGSGGGLQDPWAGATAGESVDSLFGSGIDDEDLLKDL